MVFLAALASLGSMLESDVSQSVMFLRFDKRFDNSDESDTNIVNIALIVTIVVKIVVTIVVKIVFKFVGKIVKIAPPSASIVSICYIFRAIMIW